MSSRISDTDASRPGSQPVPTPSSYQRRNHQPQHDDFAVPNRDHDAHTMEDLLKPSIVVKAHPVTLSAKPRTLQPLMLLPRQHLQLSFLDLNSPRGSFEASRFYESRIKILDLESRLGADPKVLIARLEYDQTIYVLERQPSGLYSLCHLGQWVDLDLLSHHATVARKHALKKRKAADVDTDSPQAMVTPVLHHENKKRRLAIEAIQSLVKKPPRSRSISAPSQPDFGSERSHVIAASDPMESQPTYTQGPTELPGNNLESNYQVQANLAPDDLLAQPSAEDIFDNIRNQYHEALYRSMGSLAYFAKGPLSRARAAFHLDCDSNLEMADLIEFLKGLVMTTVQIDKKYRETVPEIISKLKITLHDSQDEQGNGKPKKRKPKKMKLGKDGLYPYEDDHVRKWWATRRPQPKEDDSSMINSPDDVKLQISYLRSRETQLQMIIILEIMALEPLRVSETGNDSQLPSLPGAEDEADTSLPAAPRKRNRHNLPFLLDVHADRLCIWHSTALEEVNMTDDHEAPTSAEAQTALRATADPLKDFCVDIIMPFFSARLPEQSDSINRKLGGPVMVSPPKQKSRSKKPDTLSKAKTKSSSSAVKRPIHSRSQTLENVLSKEILRNRRSMSRGPGGVIALMRSASTSTIPALKREASDSTGLVGIPKVETEASTVKGTALFSAELVRRKSGEGRAKKDADVQAELKDAISALRKPNRDVVGKALEEDAERRAVTSLSQLKKSRKPQQHPRFHSVVKATPVGARFRDALARESVSQPTYMESAETYHPPSSASMIPSSAPRPFNRNTITEEPSTLSPFESPAERIGVTPARRPAFRSERLSLPDGDEGCVLASSPVMLRKLAQPRQLEPPPRSVLGHRDSGIGMPSSPGGRLVETPVKRRAVGPSLEGFVIVTPANGAISARTIADSPVADRSLGAANRPAKSIFQRLGWDDEEDDLC